MVKSAPEGKERAPRAIRSTAEPPEAPRAAKAAAKPTPAARKAAVKKTPAKGGRKTASQGDKYACDVCGVVVSVDEVCGCVEAHDLICCGQAMTARG